MKRALQLVVTIIIALAYAGLLLIFYPKVGPSYFIFSIIPLILMVWNASLFMAIVLQIIYILLNTWLFTAGIFERPQMSPVGNFAGLAINLFLMIGANVLKKQYYRDKEAKIEQQRHIQTLNATIENISDVIAIIDTKGFIQYISPNVEKYFGWKPESLIGTQAWDYVHPADVVLLRKKYLSIFKKEQTTVSFEFRLKSAIKNYFFVDLTAKNMTHDPLIKGILLNFNDITLRKSNENALKQSLNKYQTLINAMADAVFLLNNQYYITDSNLSGIKLTGFHHHELLGMPLESIIHPLDKNLLSGYFAQLQNNVETNLFESRIITKTGQTTWIQINSTRLFMNGQPSGILTILRDITQNKEAENQLKSLNDTKDMLLSVISHDLRNPFFSINGFSELIIKQAHDGNCEKISEFAFMINKTAAETEKLLRNLLDWTRHQTGKLTFKASAFDLLLELKSILIIFEAQAKKSDITLIMDIPKGTQVFADHNMFDTIIRNLVSNALKFTPAKGIVTISARNTTAHIEISVSDTGEGVADEDLKTLFDFEKKGLTPKSRQVNSAGLGLVLCREFVERHGGIIWVENNPTQGTTFKFTLPNRDIDVWKAE